MIHEYSTLCCPEYSPSASASVYLAFLEVFDSTPDGSVPVKRWPPQTPASIWKRVLVQVDQSRVKV